MGVASFQRSRDVFLQGLALVYFCAFASNFVQWPGLFGWDGLEPADAFLARAGSKSYAERPTLALFATRLGLHVDTLLEANCLAGMALASIALFAPVLPCFAGLFLLYLSLFVVGQTFLSFQWDILLLETGVLAAFWAPLLPGSPAWVQCRSAVWAVRFLLFKLMLMSGVVKIQAQCPTWVKLTALEYHFATQCLPTPLAWWAHQLPAPLLRLGVAYTLVLELPATLLILSPLRPLRLLGAALQMSLQVLIALSGNYNFFNALTALLCLSLVDDAAWGAGAEERERRRGSFAHSLRHRGVLGHLDDEGVFATARVLGEALEASLIGRIVTLGSAVTGLLWWCSANFALGSSGTLTLTLTNDELAVYLGRGLAPTVALALALVGCAAVQDCEGAATAVTNAWVAFYHRSEGWARGLVVTTSRALKVFAVAALLCLAVVPVSAVPLVAGLHRPSVRNVLPSFALELHTYSSPFRPVAGYGLFRRMTGVGGDGGVARPEVILEVSHDGARSWHPVRLPHKPGDINVSPTWVAPHQPRLDWQFWFAALGQYQGAPWLVHLADKVLERSPDVVGLLAPSSARSIVAHQTKPTHVRALRYMYDFTRLPLHNSSASSYRSAARSLLPSLSGRAIVALHRTFGSERSGGAVGHGSRLPKRAFSDGSNAGPWWWRVDQDAEEYLPTISRGDDSVEAFLKHHGWTRRSAAERAAVVRALGEERHHSRCDVSTLKSCCSKHEHNSLDRPIENVWANAGWVAYAVRGARDLGASELCFYWFLTLLGGKVFIGFAVLKTTTKSSRRAEPGCVSPHQKLHRRLKVE